MSEENKEAAMMWLRSESEAIEVARVLKTIKPTYEINTPDGALKQPIKVKQVNNTVILDHNMDRSSQQRFNEVYDG